MRNFKHNIRCCYCGQYISYKELEDPNSDIRYYFCPDTHFGPEELYHWHDSCLTDAK